MNNLRLLRLFISALLVVAGMKCFTVVAANNETLLEYKLGAGDTIRVQVYQNPDLALETRISEGGEITYPLIGSVRIGGETIANAEQKISYALKSGGFVRQPQVTIALIQVRSNQISVIGQVNKPGRYALESFNIRIIDIIALAGGISPTGADDIILVRNRGGIVEKKEINIASLFLGSQMNQDILVVGGDAIYVPRAPVFYIYGEAQNPGSFRLEHGMTIRQALAQGGGPTSKGAENGLRLHRIINGKSTQSTPELAEEVKPNDILYIRERIF